MAKLHDVYRQKVAKELMKQFGYQTVMQVLGSKDHPEYGCR